MSARFWREFILPFFSTQLQVQLLTGTDIGSPSSSVQAPCVGTLGAMQRPWSWRERLPNAHTLTLIGVTMTAERVVVDATGPSSARCPECGRRSHARHSRYW